MQKFISHLHQLVINLTFTTVAAAKQVDGQDGNVTEKTVTQASLELGDS